MSQKRADLLIAVISMSWGISYIFMKIGLDGVNSFSLIFLRFGIAFAVMGVLWWKRVIHTNLYTIKVAMVSGTLLFFVFAFILTGLKTTSASTSGFLTNTSVIFVPIFSTFHKRRLPSYQIVTAMILSLLGVFLLTGGEHIQIEVGALLVLMGAFCNALYIYYTNLESKSVDTFQLGVYQLCVAAVLGGGASILTTGLEFPKSPLQWGAILGLALICSAFGFVAQPIAQKYTTPERTSILFGLDAVFSAIFAFLLLGERLPMISCLGAGLVMFSVVIATMSFKKIIKPKGKIEGRIR